MGDGPATVRVEDPKLEKLREMYLQERFYRHQPTLNAIEDANWGKPVNVKINDTKWVFRKFTHAEITLVTAQPYFHKLLALQPLDQKETKEWQGIRKSMTVAVCTEPERWAEFSDKDPGWVDIVFSALVQESSVDVVKLDEFFDTDYGFNYGFVWFFIMHRTPTQVGSMSEGDYQAVNSWFRKNSERIQGKKK